MTKKNKTDISYWEDLNKAVTIVENIIRNEKVVFTFVIEIGTSILTPFIKYNTHKEMNKAARKYIKKGHYIMVYDGYYVKYDKNDKIIDKHTAIIFEIPKIDKTYIMKYKGIDTLPLEVLSKTKS
jgi:hypothetical protein